jgi:thiol-disulfide isomerase/thioredoxin
VIALVAVVVALGFGLYRARTDGRFRAPAASPASESSADPVVEPGGASATTERRDRNTRTWDDVLAALPDAQLGERATLLQFSSAFCAPCRATRQVLAEVADVVPGVVHLEVDAEHHLELVRRLDVLRTPTTLILDAAGREATRAAGAPRKETVLATLDGIV